MNPNIGRPDHIASLIVSGQLDPFDPSLPDWAITLYQAGRLAAFREVIEGGGRFGSH